MGHPSSHHGNSREWTNIFTNAAALAMHIIKIQAFAVFDWNSTVRAEGNAKHAVFTGLGMKNGSVGTPDTGIKCPCGSSFIDFSSGGQILPGSFFIDILGINHPNCTSSMDFLRVAIL
jgi:hypothetical protein